MKIKWLLPILSTIAALTLRAEPEPFVWQCQEDPDRLTIEVNVAADSRLYAASTRVSGHDATGRELVFTVPPATIQEDPVSPSPTAFFPTGRHRWEAPLTGSPPYTVTAVWLGCTGRICHMPEQQTWQLGQTIPETAAAPTAPPTGFRLAEGAMNTAEFLAFLAPADHEAAAGPMAVTHTWWGVLLLAITGGLMLNLTPCVLPMIPVNLAIIGADGTWKTGAIRASFYGAGMAVAYGTIGVLAVTTGARFGELNSSPWFNFAVAAVFLALGLSLFDLWMLDLSRWSGGARRHLPGTGRLIGAFLFGVLAALLAGACVAPVLIAVLLFAANWYADGHTPALLLPLAMGIGMALPWPFAGAGMAVLPKPGRWMNYLKTGFGVIILLAAGWYVWTGVTLLPGRGFDPAREIAALRAAEAESRRTGKPLLIDFWATWCKNCTAMEHQVMPDPAVRQELKRFVLVRFCAEKPADPAIRRELDRFNIRGLPAFVIVPPEP